MRDRAHLRSSRATRKLTLARPYATPARPPMVVGGEDTSGLERTADAGAAPPHPTAHKGRPAGLRPGGRPFTRGKGILTAPYNLAAPGLAPRLRPPVFACSDLITACSAPVPVLLSPLFRGR